MIITVTLYQYTQCINCRFAGAMDWKKRLKDVKNNTLYINNYELLINIILNDESGEWK